MIYKTLLPGAAALAAVLIASGAWAAVVPVTLTGTSENINDVTGVFGRSGARIIDRPFTETFMIDTSVGVFGSPTPTSASYNSIFDPPSGPYAVSASLTIDGHSVSTQGDDYSSAFITPGSSLSSTTYQLSSDDKVAGLPESSFDQEFSLELDGTNLPTTLTQSAQLTGTGDTSTSPFVLQTAGGPVTVYNSFIDDLDDANGNVLIDAQGTLDPTSITIGAVSAAPEPSTWALMLAGIVGIGLTLRRARRKTGFRFKEAFAA